MCTMVCPNNAIRPVKSESPDMLRFHRDRGGQPRTRGGRRNADESVLDQIKFIRISMLTDPALDAGRHEFELRTLIGRVLSPADALKAQAEQGWMPPVREIYPLMIGSMSFGALSPNMWEGLQMGVAYLNEELHMPVRVVDVFLAFDTELKKIVAPLGRSTSLPIGMSDALGIADRAAAGRLQIKYVV